MEDENPKQMFEEVNLTTEESEKWIEFHADIYKEDRKMADKMIADSPRWSIIMAYYAMHNITKLYLAKVHNLKISGENVHAKALFFISKYAQKDSKKIIPLLENAKKEYDSITSSNVSLIPRLLSKGRDERTKTQYYNLIKADKSGMGLIQAAQYFIDHFMKPYLQIMEGLL